ncbi:uncharacterized protein LOC134236802 [Saccostrea cucullata]|uniref:uncharacterized protein LOC134236802 n=1 Tax=Saccostrea cuccullata TaxID=36930 RepID=UPI002ED0ACEB
MGTLKQALDQFNQPNVHSEDKLTQITTLITQILDRENEEVRQKIEQEDSHVKKVQERLKNLQNNTNNTGPGNVVPTDGSTGDKLWKEFDLRRGAVVGELQPKHENTKTPDTAIIPEEESNYLRHIADTAFNFCCKEYDKQQKELGKALSYCPEANNLPKDQTEAARVFQEELDSDVTQYLVQKFPRKGKIVIQENERIEQYLKACVDVCWYVQIRHKGAEFIWDIQRKPTDEFFRRIGYCKKSDSCKRRVSRPALYLDSRVLNKGIYSCVSCSSGSYDPGEKQTTAERRGSTPQASSDSGVIVHQGKSVENTKVNKTDSKRDSHYKKGSPKDRKSTPEQKKNPANNDQANYKEKKGKDSAEMEKIKKSMDF